MKQQNGQKHHQLLSCGIVNWSFVLTLGLERHEILRRKLFSQLRAENIGKILDVNIQIDT